MKGEEKRKILNVSVCQPSLRQRISEYGSARGKKKQKNKTLSKRDLIFIFPKFCFTAMLLLSHFVSLPGDDGKGGGSSALHLQTPAAIGQ